VTRWLGILLLVAGTVVAGPATTRPATAAAASAHRPNVLFVLTDDLDAAELRYLPRTRALIGRRGTTFDNYFVSNSLCCPSRATTLRGQYAHNTGVWSNGGENGGFEHAYRTGVEQDTVATRLHGAGYATSLAGKYLNGYPNGATPAYVPAGWDDWASAVSGNPYTEYDYVLNQNQRFHAYQHRPRDYGTDVYVGLTDRFIRAAADADQPFFAYLPVYAPHQPATPAPRDVARFPAARAPRTPSFDQTDVSRMPRFISDLPRFTPQETDAIDQLYRQRIRSLQAADRGVARLVRTLRATRQLADTYIVFSSDNGFHLGQHRMPAGKQTAYDTDIHVPLLVRGPGVRAGAHVRALTGNIDLAPTLEAMAGVRSPSFTDGRSLVPLLRRAAPSHWRRSYLLEHRTETGVSRPARPDADQDATLEAPDPDQDAQRKQPRDIRNSSTLSRFVQIPDYDAVRTGRYLYVEYADGDRELYDTRNDPDEIDNLAGTRPALERTLAGRIAELRRCGGSGCRKVEDRAAA
jgi:N-acetylglucosamine-6-sulfatase